MTTGHRHPVDCAPSASTKMKREALSLAIASLSNGTASEATREAALGAAQRANVTTLEYLRARLLLVGRVPVEFSEDDCDI
jgi:hypothetical protein